jgi:CSLREA domain-containing protein
MSAIRTIACVVFLLPMSPVSASAVETPQGLVAITVNSTADSTISGDGLCTLREAIINANNGGDASGGNCLAGTAAAADEIIFSIPNGGNRATIALTGMLPTITDPITIQGNSQCATPPCVKLDGTAAPNPGNTLLNAMTVATGASVIRGLVFANWPYGGIQLEGAAGGNLVEGNHFGLDFDGTTATPLAGTGIEVLSPNNTIGGTTVAARNLISSNGANGIAIINTAATFGGGTVIQGNYIGTDITGTLARGNTFSGIYLVETSNNTIGGLTAGSRNVISDNDVGVFIREQDVPEKSATSNLVQGNLIGTNAAGTGALGNKNDGVRIWDASGNTVGGTTAAARNVISANGFVDVDRHGVMIYQSAAPSETTANNLVRGNYIGTDINGTADLGNDGAGVYVSSVSGNFVGGSVAGAGNVISGNGWVGIYVVNELRPTTGNFIQGNRIGTNAAGTAALGNAAAGILFSDADDNDIGGTTANEANLISGNFRGMNLTSSDGNTIQRNLIGTDITGLLAIPNANDGILVTQSLSNQIGSAGNGNRIGFNSIGINLITQSLNNQLIGNSINNQTSIGIAVQAGSTGNKFSQNTLFNNGALGIDLASNGVTPNDNLDPDTGANNLQNYPILASATAGNPVITGSLNSLANTQFTIEYFASPSCDPSGNGEGQVYLGFKQVTTNGSGIADAGTVLVGNVSPGQVITATATAPDGSTSEFSPCMLIPDILFEDGFESGT